MIEPTMNIKRTTLEQERVASRGFIAQELAVGLKHAELTEYVDHMRNQLVYEINAFVLTEKLADETRSFTFTWLDGGWQRFKQKNFPTFMRWGLLRPLKYHTEEVSVEVRSWATFPHATLTPELGRPVYMQSVITKPSDWITHGNRS